MNINIIWNGESHSVSVSFGATAANVLNNSQIKALLGLPDNAQAYRNGVAYMGPLQDGDTIQIVPAPPQKA